MEQTLKNVERTEEVQAIIDRMPTRFGFVVTIFITILVIAFFILGFTIRYPDVVIGETIINASNSSVKLIANSSGKLWINNFKSQDEVHEGDYIAVIQNSAKIDDVQKIIEVIRKCNVKDVQNLDKLSSFPRNVSVGELNVKYFTFINAFMQLSNYRKDNLFIKQDEILIKLLHEYKEIIETSYRKLKMSNENLRIIRKFLLRDSILFAKKVLTEAENDKSQINHIIAQDAYQNILKDITLTRAQIQETENKLQQNSLQNNEKEKQVYLDLISSFTDLEDNIKAWEQKYVFKSPIDGKVQFLKFWSNNQFIQSGEAAFTIVPLKNKIIGQMTLPASGAGKVKINQEVIIKLENYPYAEYGTIKGQVSSISLTTNPLKTDKGELATYLINVDLPNGLKTNYGSTLDFKYEIKGSGEIITKDRKLIERLFDNLKYNLKQ